jgi:hypothetical protein
VDINNPLDVIYSFAEQAYVRMQAGDLLMRCIDTGSPRPMQELVEGLVLAGPHSINTLFEVLQETGQRRAQVQDDLQRLYGDCQNKLARYHFKLADVIPDVHSMMRIAPVQFQHFLEIQEIVEDSQDACADLFIQAQEMMSDLYNNVRLLLEIENYLKDWLWGLAYQSAHEQPQLLRGTSTSFNQ